MIYSKLVSCSRNAVFAVFQYAELASGEVATPTSPIPPARESGPIIRKGTAVVTVIKKLAVI